MSRKMKIAVGSAVALAAAVFAIVSVAVFAASLHDGTYRSLVMKQTAAAMSETSNLDQDRVQEIFTRFVEQTPIPTGGVAGDPEFPAVIDDHAWGTLVRGRAYCDSQSMALAQILSEVGFRAQLLFLYDEDGISPHSVATVNVEGDWRVLDPLYGAIPVLQDGAWISVNEMKIIGSNNREAGYATSEPRRDQGYGSAFVPAAWFIESEVFWDSETNGPSGIRSGIESLVSVARPLLWPLVSTVRPMILGAPGYLPNPQEPGDVFYERGRTLELVGDLGGADEQYQRALEAGTQWGSRIEVYRESRAVNPMRVLVPVTTNNEGESTASREPAQ